MLPIIFFYFQQLVNNELKANSMLLRDSINLILEYKELKNCMLYYNFNFEYFSFFKGPLVSYSLVCFFFITLDLFL